jgi:hypothetical protein
VAGSGTFLISEDSKSMGGGMYADFYNPTCTNESITALGKHGIK